MSKNFNKLFASSACALIFACLATEAESAESRAIDGAGTTSCRQYLDNSLDRNASGSIVTWVQGFLSGMNMADRVANKEFVLLPDELSIQGYLDKFCTDNPSATPFEGSILLYRRLRK